MTSTAEETFRLLLQQLHEAASPRPLRVLELGTLRWESDHPTHHAAWLPPGTEHVKSDVQPGTDVDVVADAHALTRVFQHREFDAVIAVSVWEHLAQPWTCAQQLRDVLDFGGIAYVATHQTFPLHGYEAGSGEETEGDYTRWSKSGLTALFRFAGLEVIDAGYAFPCEIKPPKEVTRWNPAAPAYLNVDVAARRPA